MTARYSQPSQVRTYVISEIYSRSGALGLKSRRAPASQSSDSHQPRHSLLAYAGAGRTQLSVNSRRPVRAVTIRMNTTDVLDQPGVVV